MIPYSYNMVDMGGIDLAEANGTMVPGIYSKIQEAVNACGDVVLYNWKFASIEITPQHTSILLGDPIIINGAIQITSRDFVTIPGLNPDPTVLVPLLAEENGQYSPLDYEADGFNEVSVDVPLPILIPLSAGENGQYSPLDYEADGFSEVSVDVSPALEVLTVRQNGVEYFPSTGYQGFSKVIVAIPESPPILTVSVSGGYNGGAVVTIESSGNQLFRGVGNSPYNSIYSPNSGSVMVNGLTLTISIPNLPTTSSPLIINLSWGGINKTVQFMHTGSNTSYGYGSQSTEVDFSQ